MSEMKKELNLIKSILKAELTNQELKVVHFLLNQKEKTITTANVEIAQKLGIAQPNFQRTFKKLIAKNVIAERNNGVYVKAFSAWKKEAEKS